MQSANQIGAQKLIKRPTARFRIMPSIGMKAKIKETKDLPWAIFLARNDEVGGSIPASTKHSQLL